MRERKPAERLTHSQMAQGQQKLPRKVKKKSRQQVNLQLFRAEQNHNLHDQVTEKIGSEHDEFDTMAPATLMEDMSNKFDGEMQFCATMCIAERIEEIRQSRR